MSVLYGSVLRYDVNDPLNKHLDRFIPSKNHCVLAHIPALAEAGFIPHEEILEFQKDGGRLTGYPQRKEIGLEYSGGSLGMALSVGIGMALHLREQKSDARVYILMGDGELNEGSIWEGLMSASHYRLSNLTAIIDRNHLQISGNTEDVMPIDSIKERWGAFGWDVISMNGDSMADVVKTFDAIDYTNKKPHLLISNTTKGRGVSFMEGIAKWHHGVLNEEQCKEVVKEIELRIKSME
jgi:transketolase